MHMTGMEQYNMPTSKCKSNHLTHESPLFSSLLLKGAYKAGCLKISSLVLSDWTIWIWKIDLIWGLDLIQILTFFELGIKPDYWIWI